jgi:hypothetical protein
MARQYPYDRNVGLHYHVVSAGTRGPRRPVTDSFKVPDLVLISLPYSRHRRKKSQSQDSVAMPYTSALVRFCLLTTCRGLLFHRGPGLRGGRNAEPVGEKEAH